jgi:hypothetical protein
MVKDIKGCTWESASLFEDESVDFVFVDGDHSEEGVSRDIEAWWPKLKKTGIMAGHDYNRESVHAAVKKAFNVYESLGNFMLRLKKLSMCMRVWGTCGLLIRQIILSHLS